MGVRFSLSKSIPSVSIYLSKELVATDGIGDLSSRVLKRVQRTRDFMRAVGYSAGGPEAQAGDRGSGCYIPRAVGYILY